jgi:hypothetical protein
MRGSAGASPSQGQCRRLASENAVTITDTEARIARDHLDLLGGPATGFTRC